MTTFDENNVNRAETGKFDVKVGSAPEDVQLTGEPGSCILMTAEDIELDDCSMHGHVPIEGLCATCQVPDHDVCSLTDDCSCCEQTMEDMDNIDDVD